jgi:N-acyl-D-amino-acid deacylase
LLREGFRADITVFNPNTITDTSTYEDPRRFPLGIEHVFINGKHVVQSGKQIGKSAGRVLRV